MLSFFKKPKEDEKSKEISEENKQNNNEEGIDEFIKKSTSEESNSKLELKPEASSYFVSLNEGEDRKIFSLPVIQANELISLGYEKRLEIFLDKLKNWKYLNFFIKDIRVLKMIIDLFLHRNSEE